VSRHITGCERRRYLDAHHLDHWANGGETSPDNLTLLCTYHHRLLHEGGFRIEHEGDEALRFLRADGRAIPRGGYRLEDFVDDGCLADDVDGTGGKSLREGFCTTTVQPPNEVRETAAIYRYGGFGSAARSLRST
jgi:HNH endonuclease